MYFLAVETFTLEELPVLFCVPIKIKAKHWNTLFQFQDPHFCHIDPCNQISAPKALFFFLTRLHKSLVIEPAHYDVHTVDTISTPYLMAVCLFLQQPTSYLFINSILSHENPLIILMLCSSPYTNIFYLVDSMVPNNKTVPSYHGPNFR